MTATVVEFRANDDDRDTIVGILEKALEQARNGTVRDCAVVLALTDEDGPQHVFSYYGQAAFATLVAGVAALQFDLQYRAYIEDKQ